MLSSRASAEIPSASFTQDLLRGPRRMINRASSSPALLSCISAKSLSSNFGEAVHPMQGKRKNKIKSLGTLEKISVAYRRIQPQEVPSYRLLHRFDVHSSE